MANAPVRIVLTGGPGAGKSTAADMIGRELPDRVIVLQETATQLFKAGFPRTGGPAVRRACQRGIYKLQVELEEAVAADRPDRVILCDRGTLDGSVYWPDGPDGFFAALETTRERELGRYDAVVFFETAANFGGITPNNRFRIETADEAARLDAALRAAWSDHPRFRFVAHKRSFFAKVSDALYTVRDLIDELAPARGA